MQRKKILLTGGTGFIGSEIAKRLVSLNNRLTLIVRETSDQRRLSSIINDVEIVEGDLLDMKILIGIVKRIKPEVIFHLASIGVHSYTSTDESDISELLRNNICGTTNFLNATKTTAYELFVNTGSCFEYGNSNVAFKESVPLHPANMYGMSKVATTLFTDTFQKTNNLPIVTVRPFTVYGPGEDERRFVSTVIKQVLKSKNPNLPKGKVVRDYIFIDDVVDACMLIGQNPKKVAGEVINISTGKGTTLVDVANLIVKLIRAKGIKLNVGGFPIREGEVVSLVGDPTKIQKLLGWEAKYSLEEGLKRTIASFKRSFALESD